MIEENPPPPDVLNFFERVCSELRIRRGRDANRAEFERGLTMLLAYRQLERGVLRVDIEDDKLRPMRRLDALLALEKAGRLELRFETGGGIAVIVDGRYPLTLADVPGGKP